MAEEKDETLNVETIVKNTLTEAKRLESIEKAEAKKLEMVEKESGEKGLFECPECGGKVYDMEKFCHHCGIELLWSEDE